MIRRLENQGLMKAIRTNPGICFADMGPEKTPLDWFTRIKIAFGIATGLEYLHETANPPVIYSDLKSANVLLDDDLNPKLSDFGVANDGQDGDRAHVSSRVMRTYGYSAPEYTRAGQLTLKSDIYSYGVVLLELITGRRAIDTQRPNDEQNLVSWVTKLFPKNLFFSVLFESKSKRIIFLSSQRMLVFVKSIIVITFVL